jgi:diadenosine tetraphosphate (Ap4A) HIT family hydrolase
VALIYETENFLVEAPEKPLVSRLDGGHVVINPKVRVSDRTRFTPALAIELMRLTMLVGEAMEVGLNKRGIDVGRINYQDNGNWSVFQPEGPYQHYHLYGRAKSAVKQPYGHALHAPFRDTGFYDDCEPLDDGDVAAIREEIGRLENEARYQDGWS